MGDRSVSGKRLATALASAMIASSSLRSIVRSSELDPENETVGEGGALPLDSADGAGAGHEADTQEAQRSVQGEGGAGGGQGRSDDRGAGERVRRPSELDLQLEEAAAGRGGECFRGRRRSGRGC